MEVKFDLDKAIDTIKGWWESDLDIEIDTNGDKDTIIFSPNNDSYWDRENGVWHSSGVRVLVMPDEEYMTEEFKEFIKHHDGYEFDMDSAIQFVEDIHSNGF